MSRVGTLVTLGAAIVVGFVGTIVAYPNLAMSKASAAILANGGVDANTFVHAARVDETSRRVVRPAPDIVYSACVYDLTNGPVNITVTKPADGRYASLSFYADNTDNFAVFNDRDADFDGGLDVLLVHSRSIPLTLPSYWSDYDAVVESPSQSGIILLRRVVESDAAYPVINAERVRATCASFETE